MTTICFAAGMSGGHIIPCLSLAEQIREKNPMARVLFFSGASSRDTHIVRSSNAVQTHIPLRIIGYRRWYHLPFIACSLITSTLQSIYYLATLKPTRVISTGGIVAVPVCIAAWFLRIPIELYELNVVPGSAIKLLAPLASTLNLCFKQTRINRVAPQRVCLAPYPIRFAKSDLAKSCDRKKQIPSLTVDRTTVFIHGGSLGSQFINTIVKKLVKEFPQIASSIQVIHQTGNDTATHELQAWYAQHAIPAHVFAYDDHVVNYYHAADMIICRSGAGSLFEALFFEKPCITIPLETSSNTHQVENAAAMAYEHPELFTMIRQKDLLFTKVIAQKITEIKPKFQ